MKLTKLHPSAIGLLQTVFIAIYIFFVVTIMGALIPIFDAKEVTQEFLFPMLTFVSLFSVSALICGLGVFALPFVIFWENKKLQKPLTIVVYTAVWGVVFFLLYLLYLAS